jgi:hypothetical protein
MRIAREYAIMRPASLLDPAPEAMMAITTAIGVLCRHGLIITENDH